MRLTAVCDVDLRAPGAVVIGFALETDNILANGRSKLEKKALDLVVMNSATEPGAGFEGDTNRVTLLARDGSTEEVPLQSKHDVAEVIVNRLIAMLESKR